VSSTSIRLNVLLVVEASSSEACLLIVHWVVT